MAKCDKLSCVMDGVWNPVLVVWPPGCKGARPGKLWLNLNICELHKRRMMLEDLLTDTMWDLVMSFFLSNRMQPPDRRLTNLDFTPVDTFFL